MYATFARIVECKTLYAIYRIFTELFTKLYMHFTELHMKILFGHTLCKNPGSATAGQPTKEARNWRSGAYPVQKSRLDLHFLFEIK
jgi:hypothetical protein